MKLAKGNSKAQKKQARKNARNERPEPEEPGYNPKTDGPNRPAE